MSIFLGIDPGLKKTGWGIITKHGTSISYVASGVVQTTHVCCNTQSHRSNTEALNMIYNEIKDVIAMYRPLHCAVENTYVNSNAITSLKLAQARAVALIACCSSGHIPYEYQASTIKKIITGKGNADKLQVQKMVRIQLGYTVQKHMDESDAIAIAMCHVLLHK